MPLTNKSVKASAMLGGVGITATLFQPVIQVRLYSLLRASKPY
jgi:hypothetical protein